jgi:hypothetical protein
VEVDLGDENAPVLLIKGARDPRDLDDPLGADPVVQKARKKATKIRKSNVWPGLVFTYEGDGKPRKKTYIETVKKGVVPATCWADDGYESPIVLGSTSWDSPESGTSEMASRELTALVGKHGFETVSLDYDAAAFGRRPRRATCRPFRPRSAASSALTSSSYAPRRASSNEMRILAPFPSSISLPERSETNTVLRAMFSSKKGN